MIYNVLLIVWGYRIGAVKPCCKISDESKQRNSKGDMRSN